MVQQLPGFPPATAAEEMRRLDDDLETDYRRSLY